MYRGGDKNYHRKYCKKKEEIKYVYKTIQMGSKHWSVPWEIQIIEVCKYMGRSYQELMDTPNSIVDAIYIRMDLEKNNK